MNDYQQFLESKKKKFISSGFDIKENELNDIESDDSVHTASGAQEEAQEGAIWQRACHADDRHSARARVDGHIVGFAGCASRRRD